MTSNADAATSVQLQQLRDLGRDQFQGFYRSPAVLPDHIAKFVVPDPAVVVLGEQSEFLRTPSELAAFKRS